MANVTVNTERCKGCYLCAENCPTKAIRISANVNTKGYNYVEIDEETCIACGSCYQMCPDYVFEIQ